MQNEVYTTDWLLEDDSWLRTIGRHSILVLLPSCIPSIPTFSTSEYDLYRWRNSLIAPPGDFSSSKTWFSLHPHSPNVSWFGSVWFKQRIPKHAFMLWITMRDRLTIRDRLRSWGLDIPAACLLCPSANELRDHLFFNCSFSNEVWTSFFNHQDLTLPLVFEDIVFWLRYSTRKIKLKSIVKLIF